jgi:hypothetical protein
MNNVKAFAIGSSIISASAMIWVGSFLSHPNFKSLKVVPEWNGPDFKVTYNCPSFERMEGLDMKKNGDSTVTVNYGALGRRRGLRNFKCNVPLATVGAATR